MNRGLYHNLIAVLCTEQVTIKLLDLEIVDGELTERSPGEHHQNKNTHNQITQSCEDSSLNGCLNGLTMNTKMW